MRESDAPVSLKQTARSVRRRGWRCLVIAALSIGCGLVSPASLAAAQKAPTTARAHFFQGLEHSKAERWQEAIESFQQSIELEARASTWQNLSVALEQVGRLADAIRAIEAALLLADAGVQSSARRGLVQRHSALRALVGRLLLTVDPPQAAVAVDGESVGEDRSSHALWLDGGAHTVSVTAEGYRPVELKLRLAPGIDSTRQVVLVKRRQQDKAPPTIAVAPSRPEPTGPVRRKPFAPPRAEARSHRASWAWTTMGGGVATAAAGLTLLAVAQAEADALRPCGNTYCPFFDEDNRRMERRMRAGAAMTAIGGAAAIAGLALVITHHRHRTRTRVSFTPQSVVAQLQF